MWKVSQEEEEETHVDFKEVCRNCICVIQGLFLTTMIRMLCKWQEVNHKEYSRMQIEGIAKTCWASWWRRRCCSCCTWPPSSAICNMRQGADIWLSEVAQYDEARWHNMMKQGPRYDEAGEQEIGSVFGVVSFGHSKKETTPKNTSSFQQHLGLSSLDYLLLR